MMDAWLDDNNMDEGMSSLRVFTRSRRSAEVFSSLKGVETPIPANYNILEPPLTNNGKLEYSKTFALFCNKTQTQADLLCPGIRLKNNKK